jgi:hypothetical protein
MRSVSPNTALHRTPAAATPSPVSFQAFGGQVADRDLSWRLVVGVDAEWRLACD